MSRVIPKEWMVPAKIKGIIMHWTAGTHNPTDFDRAHYHILFDSKGKPIRGIPPISGNSSSNPKGKRASHTLNCNGGFIGVSLGCMGGAVENPFNPGKYPMTKAQWDAMILGLADLCEHYGIAPMPTTLMSHAEVQNNLKIKQRGKWDFTRLAFDLSVKGAKACGDKARKEVLEAMNGVSPLRLLADQLTVDDEGEPEEPIPTDRGAPTTLPPSWLNPSEAKGDPDVFSLQTRLKDMNYNPGGIDGIWGGKTAGAIGGFLNDRDTTIQGPTSYEDFVFVKDDILEVIRAAETEDPPFRRPVTIERAEAHPEVVAKIAPDSVPVKRNFLTGLFASIGGFFTLLFDQIKGFFSSAFDFWSDNKDALPQDKGFMQTLWEYFTSIPSTFWILGGLGLVIFFTVNSYSSLKITTDQVKKGVR